VLSDCHTIPLPKIYLITYIIGCDNKVELHMINRILEQQQPACATLIEICKPELMPTDTEISTMEDFVDVMKPIVEITEKLEEKGK